MSTTWYVPVGPKTKNAELAIRKMTGWKKYECKENTKHTQVLTDGEYFIHCDREPIEIQGHGKYVELELYGMNQNLGDFLAQIDDAMNDCDEVPVFPCDKCGVYVMAEEIPEVMFEGDLFQCRKCGKKK